MWAQVSFVLSQSMRLIDRQTNGQKGLGNTMRCTCSRTVKTGSLIRNTLKFRMTQPYATEEEKR